MKTRNKNKTTILEETKALAEKFKPVASLILSFTKEGSSVVRLLVMRKPMANDKSLNLLLFGNDEGGRVSYVRNILFFDKKSFRELKRGKSKLPEDWGRLEDGVVQHDPEGYMEPEAENFTKEDLKFLRKNKFKKHSSIVWILERGNLYVAVQHSADEKDSFKGDYVITVRDSLQYKQVDGQGPTLREPLEEALREFQEMSEQINRAGENAAEVLTLMNQED